MRIVFMGTPDFAVASLERLYADGHDVCGVFTKPDKPKNRGQKLMPSPVKELALSHATPIYQPESLRDGSVLAALHELEPELIAVVAYGKLLPRAILELPPRGCINIHGSLLPKYRGAAPVQWSVLNGDEYAGVSSMYMAEIMDAGDIISRKSVRIEDNETAGELYNRLADIGAQLLSETIASIMDGTALRIPQDPNEASYAPPLSKEQSPINWSMSPDRILRQICGLNPWPVATAELMGIEFKVFSANKIGASGQTPGSVVSADNSGIRVACIGGDIVITELQAAGGRRMAAADYLRGHPFTV